MENNTAPQVATIARKLARPYDSTLSDFNVCAYADGVNNCDTWATSDWGTASKLKGQLIAQGFEARIRNSAGRIIG